MPSADDPSTVRSLHRLVEHYTPDGVLGRTLFALSSAAAAMLALFVAAASGGGLLGLLGTVSGVAAVVAATALGLVVLWPVYLSLIGNVDSAAAYPTGTDSVPNPAESAEAVLKRRYAAGEIDHEEFEARLDRVAEYRDQQRHDDRRVESSGDDRRSRITEREP